PEHMRQLLIREEHFRLGGRLQTHLLYVADDADDRNPAISKIVRVGPESFAERVFVRPELARHRLVDDGDRLRLSAVVVIEKASLPQLDAHSFHVTHADLPALRVLSRPLLAPFDRKAVGSSLPGQRDGGSVAGGYDAGQRAHALQRLPIKSVPLRQFAVFIAREQRSEHKRVLWVDSDVQRPQPEKGPDQQSRADKQYQRQRDFDHDQRASKPAMPCARPRAPAALFQRLIQVNLRRLKRGRESEYDSGKEREQQCEAEDFG